MDVLLAVQDLVIEAPKEEGWDAIVDHVSFSVAPGSVTALIGESGSGKTTVALSALAYTKPGLRHAGGKVFLRGQDLFALGPEERRRLRGARVAYLAQSAAATFNPALTIGEQVTEPAVIHGIMTQKDADARALELYRALELPDPERMGRRYPHQVSGGQLQRLMAAMALCPKPDLLVLDEPTTALDVTTQIEVLKAFKKVIAEEGSSALYVSHDLAVVAQIADRIVVMQGGRLQEEGSAEKVINRPAHPYTRRLIAAVRKTGIAPDHAAEEEVERPLLEVRNITAGYGRRPGSTPGFLALKDVGLTIGRGETVGVIGESGCGKSTLARVIAGLLPPAKGEILLHGKPLAPVVRERPRADQRRLQIVFQMADTALNPQQKVSEIIGRPIDFYGRASGAAKRKRVAELLELVELPAAFAGRLPNELSGGQKQRVNLARALASDPELVLCDEVTSALDTIVGAAVIELLKRLQSELGVSYLFISHDLSTVAAFADAILVLYAGLAVEWGPSRQVLSPPFHPYTRLLVTSVPQLRVGWLEETVRRREAAAGADRIIKHVERGCPFFDRCPLAIPGTCNIEDPPIREVGEKRIACWREVAELPA